MATEFEDISVCTHSSGRHPYHTVVLDEYDDKIFEHFDCGYCGKTVRTQRIK